MRLKRTESKVFKCTRQPWHWHTDLDWICRLVYLDPIFVGCLYIYIYIYWNQGAEDVISDEPFQIGSCFSTGILGWGFLMCPAVFHSYAISSAPDSCPKIFHFSLNLYSCFAPNTNWILGLSFESPGVVCILYNWTIFCSCVPLYFVLRGGCLPLSTIIYGPTVSWTSQPFLSTAPGPVELCDRCVYPARPSVSLLQVAESQPGRPPTFRSHCW